MKMLKGSLKPLPVVLFFLMLLGGNSSFSFSVNTDFPETEISEDYQDGLYTSLIGEQANTLYDPLIPIQKNILFVNSVFGTVGDLSNHLLYHTNSSEDYIKRSRNIFPSLGVREAIFPFHVFL